MLLEQERRIAGWTLVTAAGAPAALVAAAIVARDVLTTSYDPLSETLSVLAGRGSGQGIMTAGFVLSAACQIATAMGLRVMRLSALIALALVPILSMSSASTTPLVCRPRWALTATLVLCALVLWVYYEANHGVFLGLAERLTAVAELAWPLVVVVFARQRHTCSGTAAGNAVTPIPFRANVFEPRSLASAGSRTEAA